MKYEDLKRLKDKKFKKLVGIPRDLFDLLITTLQPHFESKGSKGGPKPKLCLEDILLMTLYFYRNYVTFFNLGIIYKLDESNVYRWVRWTEAVLLMEFEGAIDITFLDKDSDQLIDVTECSIQRPKDSQMQEEFYSGKKEKHTIKVQIIMNESDRKILSVHFDRGSVNDFKLLKKTEAELPKTLKLLADSGYQGIKGLFEKSLTPKKKSKNNPLSTTNKELNKLISSIRISIEHLNCQLKIFRIIGEKYRSRTDTFYNRFLLICCFHNFCL